MSRFLLWILGSWCFHFAYIIWLLVPWSYEMDTFWMCFLVISCKKYSLKTLVSIIAGVEQLKAIFLLLLNTHVGCDWWYECRSTFLMFLFSFRSVFWIPNFVKHIITCMDVMNWWEILIFHLQGWHIEMEIFLGGKRNKNVFGF